MSISVLIAPNIMNERKQVFVLHQDTPISPGCDMMEGQGERAVL